MGFDVGGRAIQAVRAFAAIALVLAVMPHAVAAGLSPPAAAEPGPEPTPTAFVPFAPNVRVNSGGTGYNYQVEPTMVINSQGRIFVGWKEALTHNGGGRRVAFSYSTDEGATWTPNILMPLHTYAFQSDPWLSVTEADLVYFSRIAYDGSTSPGGIAVSNTMDGVTWAPTVLLDDAPNFGDKQSHANDATGNLYRAWNSDSVLAGSYEVMFSRSNDGGATWTPKVRVPDTTNGALGAFIKVAPNGDAYVAWWSWIYDNVYIDKSTDGGVSWGTDMRVNDLDGSAESPLVSDPPVLPALAVASNGAVYVVWNDYRNGRPAGTPNGDMDIMFARSMDGGGTWSPSRRLNDDATTARQWMPDLALDEDGGIHVAWMDDRDGWHNVYYVNSTDGGSTWGPNIRVTDAPTSVAYSRPGDYLAIECDAQGTVYVVWTDGRGVDLDIYFAKLERTVVYTFDSVPAGLQVNVDGRSYAAPASFSWRPGSQHTISAPEPQMLTPQTRRMFESWSDSGAATHALTVGETNAAFTATFRTEHEVIVSTQPVALEVEVDGSMSIGGAVLWWTDGSSHTLAVTSPQLTAPGVRYAYDRWTDGGPQFRTDTVTGPASFEVTFRAEYLLLVQSARGTPVGDGWYVAGSLASFSIEAQIEGPPGTRYVFAGWSGDSIAGTASADLVMNGPKTVTAVWRTEHLLTVHSPYGSPTGAGWHTENATATVFIDARVVVNGVTYRFATWTGDAAGTTATMDVLMDGPKTMTATWEAVRPQEKASPSSPWWVLLILAALLLIVLFLWRRRRKPDEQTPPASLRPA